MTDDLTPPHWGTEDFIEPQPGEVFDLDRALSLAVCGYRVRATNMQPGAYVDYQFAGWRINFPGGSSSGWTPRDIDREAEWVEVPIEAPKPEPKLTGGWGNVPGVAPPQPSTPIVKDVIDLSANPAEVLRHVAEDIAAEAGLEVDHASFDAAAAHLAEPVKPSLPVWAPKKTLDPNKGGW